MCDHAVLPAPLSPPDSAGNGINGQSDEPPVPVTDRAMAALPQQAAGRPAPSKNEPAQMPADTHLAELPPGRLQRAAAHGITPAAPPRKYDHVFPGIPSQVRHARKFLAAASLAAPLPMTPYCACRN